MEWKSLYGWEVMEWNIPTQEEMEYDGRSRKRCDGTAQEEMGCDWRG